MKKLKDGAWQQAMASLEISEGKADRQATRHHWPLPRGCCLPIKHLLHRGHDTAGYSKLICDKPGEKQE